MVIIYSVAASRDWQPPNRFPAMPSAAFFGIGSSTTGNTPYLTD